MVKTEFDDSIDTDATMAAGESVEPPTGLPGEDESGAEDDRSPAPLGQNETIAGLSLVAVVLAGGLYFHWRPGPTVFDNWGFSLIHPALANSMWQRTTDLRALWIVIGGSILAALVVVHRDRWRALACLIGPVLAIILAEWVLKDAVGRRYADVVSYPSGTVTAVTALGTAWIVAVPRRARLWVVILVTFIVGLECMAVIALLWHYPLDAIAGAIFGAGMILLLDGALHLAVGEVRRRKEGDRAGEYGTRPPSPTSPAGSAGGSAPSPGQTAGVPGN